MYFKSELTKIYYLSGRDTTRSVMHEHVEGFLDLIQILTTSSRYVTLYA